MKAKDVRAMNEEKLQNTLEDLKREQFNLRFRAAHSALDNSSQVRKTRRDIARLKTILAETKRAAAPAPAES